VLKNYFKIAWKVLLRRKFFTLISLFAISFTLMVLMTVMAMLDHIFRPMPPEIHRDRTLQLNRLSLQGKNNENNSSPGYAFLHRYTRGLPFVEKESFFTAPATVYSYPNGEKVAFYLKRTDGVFWQILNFRFLEGGAYTEEDNRMARQVAVINETTRHRLFGDNSALGKIVEADGQRFQVVGVVENVPIFRQTPFADIWAPIRTAKSHAYEENLMGGFNGIYLSRILERAPEIGVRKAFGASSVCLIGQFVVENILLTLIGGLLGFAGSLSAGDLRFLPGSIRGNSHGDLLS